MSRPFVARPTLLALAADHCPHAVTLYLDGAPQDRSVFAAGTAAHEYLHAVAEGRDPAETMAGLVMRGRGEPEPEPPLPADRVMAGADMARRWLEHHGIPSGAFPELVMTDGVLTTRADLVWIEEGDEDEEGFWRPRSLVVRDYKTAWTDAADRVLRLQARVQAVTGLAQFEGVGAVRVEIGNLRALQVYSETLTMDDYGEPVVAGWRADLHAMARALDGERVASPGPGCHQCPFAGSCAFGTRAEEPVARWLALTAAAEHAEKDARSLTAEEPVLGVGWSLSEKRQPLPDAWRSVASSYGLDPEGPAGGMLKALRLTSGNLGSAAKALHPRMKDEQAGWLAPLLTTKTERRWGVLPRETEADETDDADTTTD